MSVLIQVNNRTIMQRETPIRTVIITNETTILNPTITDNKPNVFTFMTLQNYVNMLGLSRNPTFDLMIISKMRPPLFQMWNLSIANELEIVRSWMVSDLRFVNAA